MGVFVDLTEFLASPHRTGIQRVSGELCCHWPADVSLTPVRLSETGRLLIMPNETLGIIRQYFGASGDDLTHVEERLTELSRRAESSGDVVDLNAGQKVVVPEVFYNPARVAFFRNLTDSQIRQFYFVAFDLLPFTHPEFFYGDQPHEIINGYTRVLRDAINIAFISEATRSAYYKRLLRRESSPGPVLRLGSDGLGRRPPSAPPRHRFPTFTAVGTIEPRKNHALILDAFEPLLNEANGMRLVFVGKMGWVDSAFGERIRGMASGGYHGFEYYSSASDDFIRQKIQESWATLYVSAAEGFGLPPVESLWLGTPVIASTTVPSLETIGSRGVHVAQPLDANTLRKAVIALTDKAYVAQKSEEALDLELPTWRSFASEVADWLK
jgi:glycosyltransferase involved in cell wall biosynthesis